MFLTAPALYDGRPVTFRAPDFHTYFHAAAAAHHAVISPATFREIARTTACEISDVEKWLSRIGDNSCVTTCMRHPANITGRPLGRGFKHVSRAAGILLLPKGEGGRIFRRPDSTQDMPNSPLWTPELCDRWLRAYLQGYYPKPTDLVASEAARIYAKFHQVARRADAMLKYQDRPILSRTLRSVTRRDTFYLAYGCTDDTNCLYEPFKARTRARRIKAA